MSPINKRGDAWIVKSDNFTVQYMVNYWMYAYGSCLNASSQAKPNSNLDQVALACTWQIYSVPSKQTLDDLPTENKYATVLSQNKLKEQYVILLRPIYTMAPFLLNESVPLIDTISCVATSWVLCGTLVHTCSKLAVVKTFHRRF
jgi:hypothetical protein